MKLSINEMILMIGPTKVFMESKLSDNFLLELLPLKGKNLTRWVIQAPGSLLFIFGLILEIFILFSNSVHCKSPNQLCP